MTKRIETVLVLMLLAPLGLAAQTLVGPRPEVAAPAADATAKPEIAAQAAPKNDLAIPAEQKPAAQTATVSTSASASFSPLPEDTAASGVVPAANSELQSQVQKALSRDPLFSKCSIIVTASSDGINLAGSAGNSRDRLAAWRLAESYARGKKVENHIVVNGHSGAATPAARPESAPPASNAAPVSSEAPPGNRNKRQ